MDFDRLTSREVEIRPESAALLVIDVQNFSARREGGEFRGLDDHAFEQRFGWFFRRIEEETLPPP
jgi:ureidoacrylate peracid hydrolase